MTDEKWESISSLIQDKFEVLDHGFEDLDPGKLEYYEFNGPAGKTRVERIVKPKVIDRKMHVATRIGAEGKEELVYSEDESVSYIKAYQWSESTLDWVEIEGGELFA